MDDKLLPCPFCSKDYVIHGDFLCVCSGCGAKGPSGVDRQQGMVLWNMRSPSSEVEAVAVEALVKIQDLIKHEAFGTCGRIAKEALARLERAQAQEEKK